MGVSNTWLEWRRDASLCKLLAKQTKSMDLLTFTQMIAEALSTSVPGRGRPSSTSCPSPSF
ncbi:Hypothetical protein FKW44_024034 [Caligus rogercresseyi]|uniref:Uncharacterized protein n=1 Tax=Caligus rogercresseyi TaxID=217165 RepID=A0A7T8GQH1_CALRO|nr:Hypothetical protein FKW44_024034 [Caligus rogercresseyi]